MTELGEEALRVEAVLKDLEAVENVLDTLRTAS